MSDQVVYGNRLQRGLVANGLVSSQIAPFFHGRGKLGSCWIPAAIPGEPSKKPKYIGVSPGKRLDVDVINFSKETKMPYFTSRPWNPA